MLVIRLMAVTHLRVAYNTFYNGYVNNESNQWDILTELVKYMVKF